MSGYIRFNDVSQWQGNYNMADGNAAVAIKMGGGDAGLYMDSKAALNYAHAVAAGKVTILYWFAGGTDPIAEADYFFRCVSPLAEGDVYALDWEVSNADPVGWCSRFNARMHELTGSWPLTYMNMSTANAHDWSPVFNNSGYWCAAPSFSFDATLPVKYPQVAQQGPIVGGVDTDAFFGSVEQLKAYGWHAPAPAPEPVPAPSPAPEPVPAPTPDPVPAPEPLPAPSPAPEPTPPPASPPPITVGPKPTTAPKAGDLIIHHSLLLTLLGILKRLFRIR